MSNTSEPLNTAPIEQFIQQVRSADASNAKEIRLDLKQARRLAYCLGETMSRLESDLEKILVSTNTESSEVININMDGGNNW